MTPRTTLAIAGLAVLLAAGCTGPTTTKTVSVPDDPTPPTTTAPADDPSSGDDTAATEPAAGSGSGETGAVVRAQLILLSSDLGADAPDPIGIPIGARAGSCTSIDPAPERAGLITAIEDAYDDAEDVDLSDPEVLVAKCGDGYAAIAKWGSASTNLSIDQFERTASGDWASVTSDTYPPCGLPEDVLELWKLDGVTC